MSTDREWRVDETLEAIERSGWPTADHAMVMAFLALVREEYRHGNWAEFEPELARCWERCNGKAGLQWAIVAPLLRRACEPGP